MEGRFCSRNPTHLEMQTFDSEKTKILTLLQLNRNKLFTFELAIFLPIFSAGQKRFSRPNQPGRLFSMAGR